MANIYGAPEISVQDLAKMREQGDSFNLLDVREQMELLRANMGDNVIWVPLSKLAAERLSALPDSLADKDKELVVMCHHGVRSAQVTAWLRHEGWRNVWSLAGGIDAYAREIDPRVGSY